MHLLILLSKSYFASVQSAAAFAFAAAAAWLAGFGFGWLPKALFFP
jgi:hypothetical protein